jgi:hypothetical protein
VAALNNEGNVDVRSDQLEVDLLPWSLPSKNGIPRQDIVNQAHFGRNLDGHAVAHAGQFRRILSFMPKPS